MKRLCLDMGTHKFAAMEVDDTGNIVKYAMQKHKFSLLKNGQIENVPMAAKELREFLAENDFDMTLPVVTAVAGKSMIVKTVEGRRRITSDFVQQEDVDDLLAEITEKASLEGYLLSDFDVAKWTLDDMIVENPIGRHGHSLEVTLVMQFFRKDTVLSLIKTLQEAGLKVTSIFSEAVASKEAAVRKELRYFNIALVDAGAGTSDITIFKEGKVCNFASIPMAGQYITEHLAQRFMVPLETAEKMKIKPGLKRSVENIVGKRIQVDQNLILTCIQDAASVLASALAAKILEANNGKAPSAVALVGGAALTPKLDEFLAQALEIPNEMVHVAKLSAKGELSKPAWAVALGLAMLEPRHNVIHAVVEDKLAFFLTNEHPTVNSALLRAGTDVNRMQQRDVSTISIKVGSELQEFAVYEENEIEPYVNGTPASWGTFLHDGDVVRFQIGDRKLKLDLYVIIDDNIRQKVPLSLVDEDGHIVTEPQEKKAYKLFPGTKQELEDLLSRKEHKLVRLRGPSLVQPGSLYKKIDYTFLAVTINGGTSIHIPVDEKETVADLLAFLLDKGLIESKALFITDGHREIGYSEPVAQFLQIIIVYDKIRG